MYLLTHRFNRTFMELKLDTKLIESAYDWFNRTFMELKRIFKTELE